MFGRGSRAQTHARLPVSADGGPVRRTLLRACVQAVHLASSALGDDVVGRTMRAFLLRRMGANLARGVTIHGGCYLSRPARLSMGEGSFLNRSCYLDLEAPVVLGERVTVGHGTTFVTTDHALGPSRQRCGDGIGVGIRVGDGSWLGANVTVLPGVSIGAGAVVAAGSVVRRDVAADTLVAGVPARVVRVLTGSLDERDASPVGAPLDAAALD